MLPEGWTTTEVGKLATFKSGGTPSKMNTDYWGGSYPWISGKDLKQHYLASSIDTLTKAGFESTNVAPIGSSLILVRGMTLLKDFPVGFATRPVAFNQDIKALIPNEDVDGLFLSYLLVAHKDEIRQLVSTAGHGTGRLETERIRSFPVKVPVYLEQKKIAQILSTWDKAITTTERLIDLARQQKKALMQQLLTGKKRLLDKNGVRFSEEWNIAEIGDFLEESRIPSKTNDPSKRLTVRLNLKGIEPREFRGTEAVESTAHFIRAAGQFIYGKQNIHKGAFGIIPKSLDAYETSQDLPAFDFTGSCESAWFYHYMTQEHFFTSLEDKMSGTGSKRLNPKTFFKIKIHCPSIEEQKKIATILSTADQEIITLQQKLDTLKQEKKALMQQLLTGKLRVQI